MVCVCVFFFIAVSPVLLQCVTVLQTAISRGVPPYRNSVLAAPSISETRL